jgi:two-component system phosphate regulon sensor histidine kinase PhoR
VLVNLVDTAVKYTPSGGRVDVTADVDDAIAHDGGRAVVIRVSDTGVGIPSEVGDRIFEPFYRVKGTRTQRAEPSTGLGLAVTRRLVDAQRGTISFTPRRRGGTTFRVTLPAAADAAAGR